MALTVRQEKFVNRYLECGNASEAYRYAYDCSKMKDKTVWEKASTMLSKDKVKARVDQLQAELQKVSDITKERILTELEAILDARITDYLEFDGRVIRFKDFKTLTDKQVKAIESIKEGKNGIELKLHGKSWSIERICKMLGFDAPEKREVKNTFGSMSDEELDAQITELLKKLKG